MRQAFQEGNAWGECKNKLFMLINQEAAEARDRYNTLLEHPDDVAAELDKDAKRGRARAQPFIAEIKQKIVIG
ncbi:MAG: tryptophanyl-tRNA synthetase [Candidatus Azotimanducaceae bacterium]|jgi:tryptophanyl-tRNA synthetase